MARRLAARFDVLSVALSAVLVLAACGDDGLSAAEAARLSQPHLSHFEGFDRWARRAVAAGPEIRDRASLEETVFAPVRRDEAVQAVWIHRAAAVGGPLSFGVSDEPPKEAEWVTIQTDDLGELDVTTAKVPDPRVPAARREGAGACVVLRHSAVQADGTTVTVTVAYRSRIEDP